MKSLLLLTAFTMAVTARSQVTLLSNNTNLETGFVLNGKVLLFSKSDSIWTTDGSIDGTYKLLNNIKMADSGFVIHNNQMYFTGVSTLGAELWKTDGTVDGTQLVRDIIPGTSSSGPTDFVIYNNKVYFTANNDINGRELWTTDGSAAGTQMVIDINPGPSPGLPKTPSITLAGNYLYFIANDGLHGNELWKTDGTATGTMIVADVNLGSGSTNFYWQPFAVLGNSLLFTTINESDYSYQVWKTDGTATGTILLKSFGPNSGYLTYFFGEDWYYKFNNKIYFNVSSGTWNPHLWVSDGTVNGTVLVKDIDAMLSNAITVNNHFYFSGGSAATGGGLWISDGTTAGTYILKEIFPNTAADYYLNLQPFDYTNGYSDNLFHGKFFFIAINNTDYQLWISDGTIDGSSKVMDMNTAGGTEITNSLSYYYTAEGLYFTSNNGTGVEPWFTDGTTPGTHIIADINPGTGSSNPNYLFVYNNRLYLNATNGDNSVVNTDLYVLTGKATVLPVSLLQFSATKMTESVHLQWLTTALENMDYYNIERSVDGANFSTIGRVNSYATSTSYVFDDRQALTLNQPIFYYRLKLVENNGTYKYSNIVTVDLMNSAFSVTFTPNPVRDNATLNVNGAKSGKMIIEIIDLSGRTLMQLNKTVNGGVIQLPIEVNSLAPGSYMLRITNANNRHVQQFIKQ
ncbi:MAG: T9SS type A sorting domain-containing protein [Candidatus Dadabacteria bacterium]